MKKNRMMRLASGMLVASMLSTSVISGTFAKYVTTASASDSARVAKWNIKMDATNTANFLDTYSTGVKGSSADKVVAPGTSGSATYVVTGDGTETAYVVTFGSENTKVLNDVYLATGLTYTYQDKDDTVNNSTTYTVPAGMGGSAGTTTVDYYPIIYTVKVECNSVNSTATGVLSKKGATIKALGTEYTFDKLELALDDLKTIEVGYPAANATNSVTTVTIGWEWKLEPDASATTGITNINNALDTVLGDLAGGNTDLSLTKTSGGVAVTSGAQEGVYKPTGDNADAYSTLIGYSIEMTATQVADDPTAAT